MNADQNLYERALLRMSSIFEWFGADEAAQSLFNAAYRHWLKRLELN